jgi:hypothetical protein
MYREMYMAPGLGFEPRLQGPKPCVLPLDDPGLQINYTNIRISDNQELNNLVFDKLKYLN